MKRIFYFCCLLFCYGNLHAKLTHSDVLYSYPKNNALTVHPNTNIGFTFSVPILNNSLTADSISVYGENNKRYNGMLKLACNGRTIIFTPAEHFRLGDHIQVRLGSFKTMNEKQTAPFFLSYSIRDRMAVIDTSFHSDDPILEQQLHGISVNSKQHSILPADYAPMKILIDDNPAPGDIYIGHQYGAILNAHGNLVSLLQDRMTRYDDFKPYSDRTFSFSDYPAGSFIITDTNFSVIDTIMASGVYSTDEHEIRKTAEGNYIIIGNDFQVTDMRQYISTGDSIGTIIDPAILVYDRQGNQLWEWRALDHFQITDGEYIDLSGGVIDFCHINAIEFDADSNLLISCRHFDEITKIDRVTGDIIWRWGGKNNQFTFIGDDTHFSYQHAIRRTAEGTYTMFDNGNFHSPQYSRAVEYRLDEEHKTATKIWEFRHAPDIFTTAMGYVQRLPNKSTLIGWGQYDSVSVTEVDSNNITRFEMRIPNDISYRAYKYDSNYVRGTIEAVKSKGNMTSGIDLTCAPNPVEQYANITYSSDLDGRVTMSLFDQLGREVSKIYEGYVSAGSHPFEFDSRNLAAGMYFLRTYIAGAAPVEKQIVIIK